jgi:hypothetical protein
MGVLSRVAIGLAPPAFSPSVGEQGKGTQNQEDEGGGFGDDGKGEIVGEYRFHCG